MRDSLHGLSVEYARRSVNSAGESRQVQARVGLGLCSAWFA
jgi:hypothetical protein